MSSSEQAASTTRKTLEVSVRALERDELALIGPVGAEAHRGNTFLGTFDGESFVSAWRALYDSGCGKVIGYFADGEFHGGAGCVKYPDMYSGRLWMLLSFMYVRPKYRKGGVRLLRAAEKQARDWGVERILAGYKTKGPLADERYKLLLTALKYEAFETNVIKEIKPCP
jgi:GNAT superfamily N-acetyltransferase